MADFLSAFCLQWLFFSWFFNSILGSFSALASWCLTSGAVVGGVRVFLCGDTLTIAEFCGAAALWEEFFDGVEFSDFTVLAVWDVVFGGDS